MKRTTFLLVTLFLIEARAHVATCATREARPEPTITAAPTPNQASSPAPVPVIISIDDHSDYSECNGEVSEVTFTC